MKLLLLFATTLFLMGCVTVVEGRGRPVDKGPPPGLAKQITPTPIPTCQTGETTATLSGTSSINITVSRGDEMPLRMATALNWTDYDQWWTTTVSYFADQPEARLPAEWITFEPAQFCIEAWDGQQVNISLAVPNSAKPDIYFGLLEFDVCRNVYCAAVAIKATITVE